MADDLDVEALLEAPFRKDGESAIGDRDNGDRSPSPEEYERKRRHKRRRSQRSRSRSRSRSPRRQRRRERSRSPGRRRSPGHHRRSRGRGSHSRERRHSRSRSRERKRKIRSKTPPQITKMRSRSKSPMYHRKSNSPPRIMPPKGILPRGAPGRPRSPDPQPPSEDRDKRTVMCMQLAARVGPKELEEFFQKVGQVREVKMISDRNSRRSKGIAYIEFHDEKSMPAAMALTGQKLFGVPIIVQPTMAEKNRLAAAAQNLKKAEGPKKLYVGSLHYNISEQMLKAIFEPFGHLEKVAIQRDETGLSKGYGFVEVSAIFERLHGAPIQFRDSESAEKAMSNLNGFELAGRAMKVNHVTERDTGAMEMLDAEDADVGVGMTPQSRASLMAKLAEGHNAGMKVPQIPQVPQVPQLPQFSNFPAISTCFMLSNMFTPSSEHEPGWHQDIRDDVLEECMKFGPVLHIYVDVYSQGNVYVKCATPQIAAAAFNSLNGRFFAGKKIVAQFISETTYNIKFPDAMAVSMPVKPLS